MKKKGETKKPKEFQRFEDFTRKLVSVPKDEILKREQEEKERKQDEGSRPAVS